ncbi:MAG: nucleotidyltransferase domain-containing protein [Elusimicrobia bacterium]|nr:nucleotidyltransferase domain-containing protein [Elusimicrobiota bacterium]
MRRRASYLKRPLNWVLAVSSHVAVLRVLKDSPHGMSGRAIAREAGFTHQAVREAIAKLEEMRIVQRLGSGKVQLIRLNRDHAVVRDVILPMFRAEQQAMAKLRDSIRQEFAGKARAATIFGSVARGEEEPASDLDLLLVAPSGGKGKLSDLASELGQRALSEYGVRLAPIVLTVPELKERAKRSEPLLANIIAEGFDLLDGRLGDLLR